MKNIFRLLRYIFNYKKNVFLNILFNVLYVFFNLFSFAIIIPFASILFGLIQAPDVCPQFALTKDALIGIVSYHLEVFKQSYGFITTLLLLCLGFVIFTLLANLFRYLGFWFLEPIRSGVIKDIRNTMYAKITLLPVSYFSVQKRGDIVSKMTSDISAVEWSVFTCLQMIVKDPVMIIVYTVTLLFASWKFVVFILILIPLPMLLIKKIGESLNRNSYRGQNKIGALLSFAEEAISMIKTTKSLNAEQITADRFSVHNTSYVKTMTKVVARQELASPLTEFFSIVTLGIVVLIGGMMVLFNQIHPAILIAFTLLFSRLISPVKELITAYYNLKKGEAAAQRINQILDAEQKTETTDKEFEKISFCQEIKFENVGFSYGSFSLENINFTIKKGQKVAIVGSSGSGKSTLLDLFVRFIDVNSGRIAIDGKDIRDIPFNALRSLFGMVTQESILFNDTVRNNITLGLKAIKQEDIEKACKIACIDEVINQLPLQYDTVIGDRGMLLSGGQRQRLCIARAVLRNPPILLMDEATSAMDTENEKKVISAIESATKDRTTITVAHRLSTIIDSDMIIVMDSGKIAEIGNHKSLLQQNGHYSKLIKLQKL